VTGGMPANPIRNSLRERASDADRAGEPRSVSLCGSGKARAIGASADGSRIKLDGMGRAPRLLALGLLSVYRAALSPLLHVLCGPACRFEPSCSRFAAEAIGQHGLRRGGAMTLKRLARCHPLGGYGYDPVPVAGHIRKK